MGMLPIPVAGRFDASVILGRPHTAFAGSNPGQGTI